MLLLTVQVVRFKLTGFDWLGPEFNSTLKITPCRKSTGLISFYSTSPQHTLLFLFGGFYNKSSVFLESVG